MKCECGGKMFLQWTKIKTNPPELPYKCHKCGVENVQVVENAAFRQKHGRPPSGYLVLFADGTEIEFLNRGISRRGAGNVADTDILVGEIMAEREIYLQRNLDFVGAHSDSSILSKSIAEAGFFLNALSTNPSPTSAKSSAVGKLGRSRRPHKPETAGSNPACAFPVQVERSEQETGAIEISFSNSHTLGSRTTYVEKAGLIFRTNHHLTRYSSPNALFSSHGSSELGMRLLDSISSIAPSFESANKK